VVRNHLDGIDTIQAETRDPLDVGKRLRTIRQGEDLSQRELAKRAGVNNGTISLIEQGRISPSVALLKKLLDAMNVTFIEFFSLAANDPDMVFFSREQMVPLTKGQVRLSRIGGSVGLNQIQILYEEYAPKADTGEEMLQHEGEEGGIVIRGKVEVTVGELSRVLGPGEGYYFDTPPSL
jgi:transcriptional regulator with XRE-family HTH domain